MNKALQEIERIVTSRRCSDGNCIWGHPGGMATNGGCRYDKMDKYELRRDLRAIANELRQILRGAS